MKPAFIYVNAGKGHYIPAKALYDTYTEKGEIALIEDLFEILESKNMKQLIQDNWRYFLRHPATQPYAYQVIDNPVNAFILKAILNNRAHMKAFDEWMKREKPDLLLSTNFIGGLILPNALESLGYDIPVFQYAADCVATPRVGVNNKIKYMYLPTIQGIRNAIKAGMHADKVRLSPFPLQYRIENSRRLGKKEAREKISLEDMFTIALSVGGEGICRLEILKETDSRGLNIQFILLGSISDETRGKLEEIRKDIRNIKIVTPGFVDNINEYIEASDMTMGKAGANSVMESIYLKRFTLVSDQLYPFESAREILEENHIGRVENSIRQQADIIEELMNHPERVKDENFEKTGIVFSSRSFIEMLLEDYSS